ncbi:MAG: HesA/MoeB/ThiF family protein [Deltaproteobacteria bacterium]|nr:HesA/MoeB/ThiF family protein [Deltaproteobacteria bacterium]
MLDVPNRYSRHVLLEVIGQEGQDKIRNASVLVAGLGALGSTISILLARAGVGFLRIVDKDSPELHNLHRQILYNEEDVYSGLSKAVAARSHLLSMASNIEVEAVNQEIEKNNVFNLLDGIDLVVDALDNSETRFIVNDAIMARSIPYIFGGAVETVGNVMTIIPGRTPCLRCIWPEPSSIVGHARAATVGVLSSVASLVASIQVTEIFKILVGDIGNTIPGILVMDVWKNQFHVVPVEPNPDCSCGKIEPR